MQYFKKSLLVTYFSILIVTFYSTNSYTQISHAQNPLSYLKSSYFVSHYEWDNKNNIASGVLKNGYVFQAKAWNNSDESGSEIVFMTLASKYDIIGGTANKKQYTQYIEKQAIGLIPIFIKDKESVTNMFNAIKQGRGTLNAKNGNYFLLTESSLYTEITILIENFDYGALRVSMSVRTIQ